MFNNGWQRVGGVVYGERFKWENAGSR